MSDKTHAYPGEQITVQYNLKRCIHAAQCVHGLPAVFDATARPWVKPDQATADEVVAVVERCPSGALLYERKDGGAMEQAAPVNSITLNADGPLYVRGDVEIVTADGTVVAEGLRMALCRCGGSANKPFCDLSHVKIGFQAAGTREAMTNASESTGEGGRLRVLAMPNGSLRLQGQLEVRADDGQVILRGEKTALCRCGHSNNKPFCDGTHKQVGFQTE